MVSIDGWPVVRRSEALSAKVPGNGATGDDETVRRTIELLFFAYRQFTGEADVLLARYGFGRAHHRVIYFVGREPGMTVSALLRILGITKQSLARVLSQLMREGFVVQRTDSADRRRRRLYLTPEAEALEGTLTGRQMAQIAAAFAEAGPVAAEGFRAVLLAMIDPLDRQRFAPRPQPPALASKPGGEFAGEIPQVGS
jgi:DNA-binding MarR family transcriptional regulator